MIYKRKNDTLDVIKIQNFCSAKDPVKRIKREATDREKLLTKYISGKSLVSEIYKELSKLNSKK